MLFIFYPLFDYALNKIFVIFVYKIVPWLVFFTFTKFIFAFSLRNPFFLILSFYKFGEPPRPQLLPWPCSARKIKWRKCIHNRTIPGSLGPHARGGGRGGGDGTTPPLFTLSLVLKREKRKISMKMPPSPL